MSQLAEMLLLPVISHTLMVTRYLHIDYNNELDTNDVSGCMGPSGHPDCLVLQRARDHQEPQDQGLHPGEDRVEAGDQ